MEQVIIQEAQKGTVLSTVRNKASAYRQMLGLPQSVRLPAGWVANIHTEHLEEKPEKSPVKKTPVKAVEKSV